MKFSSYSLDKRANEYLSRELSTRRGLGKAILQELDIMGGNVTALLPEKHENESGYHFNGGWTIIRDQEILESDLNPISSLVKNIADHLSSNPDGLIVIEDGSAKPTDKEFCLADNVFFSEQDVFHFLKTNMDQGMIEKILYRANTFPGPLGILTNLPTCEISNLERSCVDEGFLKTLARNAKTIFIDAYDSQSYLTWHRPA